MKRILLSWSSGKDSAWALYCLRQKSDIEVVALVTSFNSSADRVAMHAVRRALVAEQAERLRLPLWSVELPSPCTNEAYEELMRPIWTRAAAKTITEVAFGDLFLQDIRGYRERQLRDTGLTPIFPLWQLPTRELADQMLGSGVKAKVTCVDPRRLDPSFAGREFDANFLAELPPGIDPCGENGEFHTFVYDSPAFSSAIPITSGETVRRDGFVFADVLPAANSLPAGLCNTCAHVRIMTSDRGSSFYRCGLSDTNATFARYPRLPVLRCSGWTASKPERK